MDKLSNELDAFLFNFRLIQGRPRYKAMPNYTYNSLQSLNDKQKLFSWLA